MHAAPSDKQAMFRIGRRGLHESVNRICSSPACAVQDLTSLVSSPAYNYKGFLPCQPSSALALRQFATASLDKYDPQGEMSAVTFHGPRTMKVSKKPKPSLQTPGVCMPDPGTPHYYTAQVISAVLHSCYTIATPQACKDVAVTSALYRMSL